MLQRSCRLQDDAEETEDTKDSSEMVTEAPSDEELVTEAPSDEELVTEAPSDEDMVTEAPSDEELVTEAPSAESQAGIQLPFRIIIIRSQQKHTSHAQNPGRMYWVNVGGRFLGVLYSF